ncbi:hypothetical protein D3C76_1631550 [compost metagenome]
MPTAVPFTRNIGQRLQRLLSIARSRVRASWLIAIDTQRQAPVAHSIWSWIGLARLMEEDSWMAFLTFWNSMPHDTDA